MRKLIRRLAGPCDQRDALGIALGCLSLLLACVLATRRNPYFWYDEVATATLVRDPSVTHMLGAIVRGAENNPPLYQLALRGWIAIFGDTALSMRLPSALCASVALAIAWRTLRRWYSTAAVSLGIGVGILGSITIIDQVAQARSYGFFLLAAASAFAATVSAMRSDRTARASLLLLFLTHLFLVYSHTLGLASSGSLLAAAVVVDAWRGRLRPLSYGAVVAAWPLFAPWVPTLLRQGKIATPRNWLLPPDREAFFAVLGAQTRLLPIALVVVAVASTLSLVRGAAPVEDAAAVDVSDER
ncbi:MAG TPA: glycosyltransferase family 39 protein, partial [Gemmatimonadaceae bacterium]|nr:glycosyltransferase family 39 protein [Gemmatimonadaceae bacterium]